MIHIEALLIQMSKGGNKLLKNYNHDWVFVVQNIQIINNNNKSIRLFNIKGELDGRGDDIVSFKICLVFILHIWPLADHSAGPRC